MTNVCYVADVHIYICICHIADIRSFNEQTHENRQISS